MDEWGWEQLRPWLNACAGLPVGPLFCFIDGPTRGRPWSGAAVRGEFRRPPPRRVSGAGSRPIGCVTHTRSSWRVKALPLNIIQRHLGHANLGTTSFYLQGIDPEEIIATVHIRQAPMMSARAGLRL